MEPHVRSTLEDLLVRLHLIRDDEPAAATLHDEVSDSLEHGPKHGLVERINEAAVELETGHPALAAVLRKAVDVLSAAGA
jgi:Domain of unknown function (DUF4404)